MVLNATRYFSHRLLAHLTDSLTRDGRLSVANRSYNQRLWFQPESTGRTRYSFISSSRTRMFEK